MCGRIAWPLTVVAVLQVISTLASLYLPTVNAAIIDDGVAKGDTGTIVELGGVMLAVTGLQVLCAVGAVYFGSRAAHGLRPRPAVGDLSPRDRLLGGRDGAVRRTVPADPHHQRRPAGPAVGAVDLHDADHRADHVDRRHLHGGAPGRRAVVAAAGQRSGAGAGQLLGGVAPAAHLPRHAAAHRRHQPGDARAALGHPGDPGLRARAVRAQPIRRGEPGACRTPR